MNAAALISIILYGMLSPLALELPQGMTSGAYLTSEEVVIAAVVPECSYSYEETGRRMQAAADSIARETGKTVVLTRDLLTYMTLVRIRKRGLNRYERASLASRIAKISEGAYLADPPSRKTA